MLALAAVAGCGSEPPPPSDGPRFAVAVAAGDAQRAPSGGELAAPLAVAVTDSSGLPVRGVVVRFRVVGGRGAALVDSLAVSDAAGVAFARLRVGVAGDTATVEATVRGQRAPVARFRAAAAPGAALDAVAPAQVGPGDTLVLRGSGLAPRPDPGEVRTVLVGGRAARVVGADGDSLLRVEVPPCLPDGTVRVAVRVGAALTAERTVGVRAGSPALVRLAPLDGTTIADTDLVPAGTSAGCLRLPGDGGDWLVVPHFAGVGDSTAGVRSALLAVDTAAGPSATRLAVGGAGEGVRTARPTSPYGAARRRLELALRERERALAPGLPARLAAIGASARAAGAQTAAPTRAGAAWPTAPLAAFATSAGGLAALAGADGGPALATPPTPEVPLERAFRVLNRVDGAAAFTAVTARLRHAGRAVLLYEDRAAPAPLDDATARRLGTLFDEVVHPLDVGVFGTESDVDGNGRVIVLLSPVVNALVPSSRCASDGYVPGFFYSPDLDPRAPGSNGGEVFYAFVPDPNGRFGCPHELSEVGEVLPPTFAHELQHMISFNEHVLARGGPVEDTWLNEGLSHVAEELLARRFDRGPGTPLGDTAVVYLRGNLESAALFLANPSAASALVFQQTGTTPERGAAWLLLRWLGAQHGPEVYGRLVRSGRTSRRNVEAATGEPFAALFGDWALALAADSLPGVARSRVPRRLRFGDERPLRELFARGLDWPVGAFPLEPRPAPRPGTTAALPLRAGGLELFLLRTTRGAPTLVRFAPPQGSFPGTLEARVGLFRLEGP